MSSLRRSLLRQTKIATAEARLRKKAKKDLVRQATIQGTLPDIRYLRHSRHCFRRIPEKDGGWLGK
jgi:hypothetical protein